MNYFPPGRKSEFDWNGGKAQLSCFSINPQARHCPEDGGTETHKRFSKEDLQMASKPRKDGQYHWSLEKEIEGTRLCPLAPMRTAKTRDSHQRGGERMLRSLEAHPLLWGRKVCWAAQQLLSQIHTEGAEKSRKSGTAQIPTVCWKDKCGSSTWWNIGQQQVKSEALADKLLQSCYWQASSGRSRVVSFRSCEDRSEGHRCRSTWSLMDSVSSLVRERECWSTCQKISSQIWKTKIFLLNRIYVNYRIYQDCISVL